MDKKKEIKTTDWLIRGFTEEELAQKKKAAIEEAERELKEKDIGKEIYELACLLYKNKEYNLGWHDCIYLADNTVKRGYRKQVEGEWVAKTDYAGYGYYCSNCNAVFTGENAEWIAKEHHYCPKCGAKMRNGE